MTNQEAFEKIARHLLTQNERSEDDGVCRYRSPTGLKCAIGCLIPDWAYSPSLEGYSVAHLPGRVQEVWRDVDITLLNKLQMLHDHAPPSGWRLDLVATAKNRGLKMPEDL